MSDTPLPYATPSTHAAASTSSMVFGLIVRTTGLAMAVYGAYMLVTAAIAKIGFAYDGSLPPETCFVYGVFWAGAGAALLKCGWLVRFAYGREA